jgi:chloramphenicol-sensitive protein RarD
MAYSLWGVFPLYWLLLAPANPLEIVSHRAVWTLVFCFIVLAATKALKSTLETLKRPMVAAKLFLSSLLVSINWLVYIWATNNEHVVEASLGYYINPLIIIGFGVIFLKEKMRGPSMGSDNNRINWCTYSDSRLRTLALDRFSSSCFLGKLRIG